MDSLATEYHHVQISTNALLGHMIVMVETLSVPTPLVPLFVNARVDSEQTELHALI